ncbi:hypothetical protein SADUNF_Sadunf13G0034700 [Salix dunnii]|uniref:Malectin domain-containing protein n=1 Tax=Salix dunnii TaxID=1413687 RepID=A0A835JF94_9ROSI|nr:hypothetical protein SADUNF_Sadunf13G0034700 [Salix dunnii]
MVAQMVMGENGNQMSDTLLESIHTPELNTKTVQLFLSSALTLAFLIKEHSLAPVNYQILKVTFKPADRPDAFALINAIESVPITDLFGSGTMVGFADQNFDASVAPPDVYRTARGMGYHKDLNLDFNLTWLFQADANFTYVVRLHFFEFQLTKVNQKVFNIDINNQTAQVEPNAADIIEWTGEMGVPTYKDHAVVVKNRPGDEEIRVDLPRYLFEARVL